MNREKNREKLDQPSDGNDGNKYERSDHFGVLEERIDPERLSQFDRLSLSQDVYIDASPDDREPRGLTRVIHLDRNKLSKFIEEAIRVSGELVNSKHKRGYGPLGVSISASFTGPRSEMAALVPLGNESYVIMAMNGALPFRIFQHVETDFMRRGPYNEISYEIPSDEEIDAVLDACERAYSKRASPAPGW